MWMILQQEKPDDYVLATGEMHSVREVIELAFACTERRLEWRGHGVDEQGHDASTGDVLVVIDQRYFRPTEVDLLLGDPSKARARLGWKHRTGFKEMIQEMVEADLELIPTERERRERDA